MWKGMKTEFNTNGDIPASLELGVRILPAGKTVVSLLLAQVAVAP